VLESAGSGAGRHVLDLAAGLLRHGHRVHLAWSPVRAEPAFAAGLAALDGLTCHAVAMGRAPGRGDLGAVRALRRLLRLHRIDVVHGHSSKAGALARLACVFSGVPALYTPHAFVTLDPQLGAPARSLYGAAERVLALLGARIVCVSPEEREHALGLGIPAHRLALVPNGLAPLPAPDRARARAALGLDARAVCVGFVGRLTPQKAVARLVAAFAQACPPGSAGRLVIVGDGPERERLARQVQSHALGERVLLAGAGDGPALMAAFDLFVLPSRYEALPYVLLEAAARALPIVTTAVGGAALVVRPGENGWIVPQADSDADTAAALAAPIAALVGDEARRAEMGRRSAAIAGGLGVDAMVERTIALYREALAPQ
jgi:glycosyltransferase involved in cell wall biosynthesis